MKNTKDHYRAHKDPPFHLILCHIHPKLNPRHISVGPILILSLNLWQVLLNDIFLRSFLNKTLFTFVISFMSVLSDFLQIFYYSYNRAIWFPFIWHKCSSFIHVAGKSNLKILREQKWKCTVIIIISEYCKKKHDRRGNSNWEA